MFKVVFGLTLLVASAILARATTIPPSDCPKGSGWVHLLEDFTDMDNKAKWAFDDDGNDGSKRGYHDGTGWVMTLNKTRGRHSHLL